MNVLLIGGTGVVGSEILKKLLENNQHHLQVLTTSPEKAKAMPNGVEPFVGNLEDLDSVEKAFQGIDAVFMLNQHTLNEVKQGLNAVELAIKANVKKIVFQSIHLTRQAPHVDHFYSKVVIEDAIINSGLNYVFISPNNFYQNDANYFKQPITDYKLYVQPLGNVGVSRVDVRDIAEAVVNVLNTDRFDGKNIALVGPEELTGISTAAILSEKLGYQINYIGDNLEQFKESLYPFVPEWQVDDWAEMYGFFQKKGLRASTQELQLLTEVLGHEPRSYRHYLDDYIQEFTPLEVEMK